MVVPYQVPTTTASLKVGGLFYGVEYGADNETEEVVSSFLILERQKPGLNLYPRVGYKRSLLQEEKKKSPKEKTPQIWGLHINKKSESLQITLQ